MDDAENAYMAGDGEGDGGDPDDNDDNDDDEDQDQEVTHGALPMQQSLDPQY